MNSIIAGPKLTILSHSQRQQLEDCPWGWYLARRARDEHGQRYKPMTAGWFHHGTAVHEVAEYGCANGWDFDAVAAFNTVYDRIIAKYRASHPDDWEWLRGRGKSRDEDIAARRELGAQQVLRLAEWMPEQLWKIWRLPSGEPALEVEFLLKLGDVYVRGFIDAVWEWPDGTIDVVDWKTGTKAPSDNEQLELYKLALEELCGATIAGGRYMMLRDFKYERRDLAGASRERLTQLYADAAAVMEGNEFPAKPGKCFTCTMKRHCAYKV